MNRIFFSALFLSVVNLCQAQFEYAHDMNRLFAREPVGSARIQAIGGAGVALGGDISAAYINPAGLGYFRKSEVSLSPSLNFHSAESDFLGTSQSDNKVNFNFNQLGVVFKRPAQTNGIFKGGAFAITFNRIADFHDRRIIDGNNTNNINSIIDYFLVQSQGWSYEFVQEDSLFSPSRDFTLAYTTGLISPVSFDPDNGEYFSTIEATALNKRQEIETSGALNEWSLAYGGNLDDTFYFGAKIGIQSLDFEENTIYLESVFPFANRMLNNLQFDRSIAYNGIGINIGAGFIWRIHDYVRWGATVTSPTYHRISYEYTASLGVNYDSFEREDGTIVSGGNFNDFFVEPWVNDFALNSPARFQTGISAFSSKNGFISIDAEYTDYSSINMRSHETSLYDVENDFLPLANGNGAQRAFTLSDQENAKAKSIYTNAWNIRAGGEYRLKDLRFRLGYAYYQSPYGDRSTATSLREAELDNGFNYVFDTDRFETSRQFFSIGAGYRKADKYLDLTLQHARIEEQRTLYPFSNEDGFFEFATATPAQFSSNTLTNFKVLATLGILF